MLDQEFIRMLDNSPAGANGSSFAEAEREQLVLACNDVIQSQIKRVPAVRDRFEDLNQDAWVTLLRRLKKFGVMPLDAELLEIAGAIAWRLAIKRARRWPKRRPTSLDDEEAESLVDPLPSPHAELEWVQDCEWVRHLVEEYAASLHGPEDEIVRRFWLDAWSLAEIGANLGLSKSSIWSVVRRIKPRLSAYLRRHGAICP